MDLDAAYFLLETRLVALDFLIFLVLVSVLASDSISFAFAFLAGHVFILMKPVLEGSPFQPGCALICFMIHFLSIIGY